MRIPHDRLEAFIRDLYVARGVPPDEAATVAARQVEANLVGHDSHGVIKTVDYLKAIEAGHVLPGAPFEVVSESPGTAVVDGHWGFGFVVTEKAMNLAIAKARETGAAAVVVRRQGHVGRLGAYTAMAAEQGMIGLMTADSGRGPKSAAPFGGRERRLGTNPISIAVPSDLPGTPCIDVATTSVASGKLNVARARGERIPLGWIVDRDGKPTDDPEAYYRGGALLPLGGDQGHKGYGLSFMVEILSGILPGLGFGVAPDGRHNDGCFLAVFDVSRFLPVDSFRREVAGFVEFVKSTRPAEGFDEVLYPGELEWRLADRRRREGIEIEESTWTQLLSVAQATGVAAPV